MIKILLVEDEEMIREMYELALNQAGFEVEAVGDGQVAVDKLTQQTPDYKLVLLDVMLPGLDGISVLKEMKKSPPPTNEIPVFLLTNLGLEDLVQEAMELGASKYLVKSNILPQQIIEEINSFLNKSSPQN